MFRPAFNTTFWEYNVYATQEQCSQDICRLSINRTLFMGFIDHAQTKMW